jgi:hypothetical protein
MKGGSVELRRSEIQVADVVLKVALHTRLQRPFLAAAVDDLPRFVDVADPAE